MQKNNTIEKKSLKKLLENNSFKTAKDLQLLFYSYAINKELFN